MGFFSWKTVDTNRSIANSYSRRKTFPVTMIGFGDEGIQTINLEKDYDGYGVFGGVDFYELMARMNGFTERDLCEDYKELRQIGIHLYYHPETFQDQLNDRPIAYPQLFEKNPPIDVDFSNRPDSCECQGFFY